MLNSELEILDFQSSDFKGTDGSMVHYQYALVKFPGGTVAKLTSKVDLSDRVGESVDCQLKVGTTAEFKPKLSIYSVK